VHAGAPCPTVALTRATLLQVRSELVPDAASITAKLHKINIYEKGGFFADHKVGQLDPLCTTHRPTRH
jgi:hypothetical protein